MANRFGGVGVSLPLNQLGTNGFVLQPGEVMYIPSGYFNLRHGGNSTVQTFDPVMNVWRPCGADGGIWMQVDSDGNNYRVANQTACPVAALLTNAGSGYSAAPSITPSAGASSWTAVMGQVVSTVVNVVLGGSNYQYPPQVVFQAPPSPGVVADGYATISGGAVTSITMIDQGAGYITPPAISLINDPRDNTGSGAFASCNLTGLGTVTAVICTNHGVPITTGTVPTLAFSGGGGAAAAATVIMDWTVTSYAVTSGGAGYTGAVLVQTLGTGIPTTATAYINPNSQASFLRTRPANITGALAGGALVAAGQVLQDGGVIGGVTSNVAALTIGATGTTVAVLTFGVGGGNDFLWMQQG